MGVRETLVDDLGTESLKTEGSGQERYVEEEEK